MKDYKHEIATYLDQKKNIVKYNIEITLEEIRCSKHVCVFGIGMISYPIISAIRNLTDIKIDFLCDNDQSKWGNIYHDNLRCVSPKELEKYGDNIAILIATRHYKEIYEQLKRRGLNKVFVVTEYRLLNDHYFKNKENIETIQLNTAKLIDILEDEKSKQILSVLIKNWFEFDVTGIGYKDIFSEDQYYPTDIIRLREDESFVDVGAYNGDTLLEFIQKSNQKFESIFAFELNEQNFKEMERTVNRIQAKLKNKIKLYNFGLFDEEKNISYKSGGSGSESTCINIIGTAGNEARTVRLSDILKNDKVTYMKMDIEGSELRALYGAETIIKNQKPKLATCVYHRPEHLWEVPLYLKRIVPEYKIYLRHHNPLEYETVCYAVI